MGPACVDHGSAPAGRGRPCDADGRAAARRSTWARRPSMSRVAMVLPNSGPGDPLPGHRCGRGAHVGAPTAAARPRAARDHAEPEARLDVPVHRCCAPGEQVSWCTPAGRPGRQLGARRVAVVDVAGQHATVAGRCRRGAARSIAVSRSKDSRNADQCSRSAACRIVSPSRPRQPGRAAAISLTVSRSPIACGSSHGTEVPMHQVVAPGPAPATCCSIQSNSRVAEHQVLAVVEYPAVAGVDHEQAAVARGPSGS